MNTPVVSNDYTVIPRKADKIVPLPRRDWNRIKTDIKNLSEGTNWWELAFSTLLGIAVTLWVTIVTGDDKAKNYEWLWRLACSASLGSVVTFFAMKSNNSQRKNSKQSLQDEMDYLEEGFDDDSDDTEDVVDKIPKGIVVQNKGFSKTNESQGLNYVPIELNSQRLSTISMDVNSDSVYWRAGFKFMKNSAPLVISTLGEDSALIHITRTDDVFSLTIYPDGTYENRINKVIDIDLKKTINLTVDRSKDNYVSVYVNDKVEYNERLNGDYFDKVALLVWGDDKDYEVKVGRVEYVVS